MADSYFKNFPAIQYANSVALNITDRTRVLLSIIANPYLYYPMDLTNGVRADQVAQQQYGDPFRSWILYLGNQIIDPYYQWYLTPEQFNGYLLTKYSPLSIADLQQRVKFFRNNWYSTIEPTISIAAYDDLDFAVQKFWKANYYDSDRIIDYSRVQQDWKISTNKVVSYLVSSNTLFSNDEIVSINYLDANSTVGSGQVVDSNSTVLVIQHVSGTPCQANAINGNSYVYGTESGANVHFTSPQLIANNIPDIEDPYWDPVVIYDWENEQNEYNKTVNILDPRFAGKAVSELKQLLS